MQLGRLGAALGLLAAGACTAEPDTDTATVTEEIRVCADGPTVEGIDVSKWQSTIDWDAVAADGIRFAFIRTTDGTGYLDEKYDFNWGEARRVGILRGTYQFFEPGQDPVAQADLLLDRMGALEDGDLPPVLDVEADGGQSAATIVAGIRAWSDRITAATGVVPIIYTAKYFWQDSVGAPADFLDQPLWVANYTTECPLIADPWPRWDFWQYTSTGHVAGIGGNVDRDVWNGTEDDLLAFAWHPDPPPGEDPPPGQDPPPGEDPPPDDPPGASGGCNAGGAAADAGGAATVALLLFGLALSRRRRSARGRRAVA